MIIYNANILTMARENYSKGYVEFSDGKITAIGSMKDFFGTITDGDIDAAGKSVCPGFIDCHSHIGAWEDGLGFEGDDGNEETDPSTPQLRAIDMINPLDRCFEEAANAGVTSVVCGMGSANPIGGAFLAMKTSGSKRIDKRIIKEPVSIKFALGENPKSVYKDKDSAPVTRMATAAIIREQLYKAKRYLEDLTEYDRLKGTDDEIDKPDYDAKCEALIPLMKKEIPAHFHCHRADDIFTAIRLAKEFDIDYVLIHCTEGHLIADELADENARAVVGPVLCDRSKPELKNHTIGTAGVLSKSGILTAICTDHPVIPQQYLALTAGLAVKGGMDEEEALRAITINPAVIAGIDNRVGSLEVGKDADILIFADSPFETMTDPDTVIIDGRIVK